MPSLTETIPSCIPESGDAPNAGQLAFDWGVVVPFALHPTKVAIIEALRWIGDPLSAIELEGCFGGEYTVSHISYHLRMLAKHKVVVKTSQRQVRGAIQKLYFFPTHGNAATGC